MIILRLKIIIKTTILLLLLAAFLTLLALLRSVIFAIDFHFLLTTPNTLNFNIFFEAFSGYWVDLTRANSQCKIPVYCFIAKEIVVVVINKQSAKRVHLRVV